MSIQAQSQPICCSKPRFYFGVSLFICGRLTFLLIPIVRSSSLDADWKNILSVLCVFGLPDLFTVLAVVVLGRAGFSRIKQLLFSSLRRFVFPAKVGKIRYRTGLVMFFLPIIFGWSYPYLNEVVPWPITIKGLLIACSDVLFISSFFVLGGEFWGKLRALFMYSSQTVELQNK